MEQRTIEWHRARLGKFTGSEVYKLMSKGKGKDKDWSQEGLSYINQKIGERLLDTEMVMNDESFNHYLEVTEVTTKHMQYGIDNEDVARKEYERINLERVDNQPFVAYNDFFGDSPDGYVKEENKAVEIKCLTIEKFVNYKLNCKCAEDLKAIEKKYYWQCVAHMAVLGAGSCEFIVYNEFMREKIFSVTIERNEEDVKELISRVELANEYIESIINI